MYRELVVPAETYQELRRGLERKRTLGLAQVELVDSPDVGLIEDVGSGVLSGGTSDGGQLSLGLLEELSGSFPTIVLPGVTAAQLAAVVSDEDMLELEKFCPALIVLDAEAPTDPTSGWLDAVCSDASLRSKLVLTAACTGLYNEGTPFEYRGGLAANLGAVIGLWGEPTAKPMNIAGFGPVLSSSDLFKAASAGINAPTMTVMRPACWWYGVTRDASIRLGDVRAYIEIVRLVRTRLEPLIGKAGFEADRLSDISAVFDECVESVVTEAALRVDGSTIVVSVECRPVGSVRTVSFVVPTRASATLAEEAA